MITTNNSSSLGDKSPFFGVDMSVVNRKKLGCKGSKKGAQFLVKRRFSVFLAVCSRSRMELAVIWIVPLRRCEQVCSGTGC